MKTLLVRYFSGVTLLGSLLWLFYAQGYRIITTPSVPPGIWKIEPLHGPLRRGQFVWLCPPNTSFFRMARQRGYIPEGDCPDGYRHLLKPVAAISSDVVSLTSQGVTVNGKWLLNSQSLPQDIRNFPLPQLVHKTYIVQTGSVWLVSTYHPKSFDSRYFGPIHAGQVEAIAKPVFVLH